MRQAVLLCVAVATPVASASAAYPTFKSPTKNIVCMFVPQQLVECNAETGKRNADVDRRGHVYVGRGIASEIPPPGAVKRVLGYGKSFDRYGFRCLSTRGGVRCVHSRTGHGFVIAQSHTRKF